MSDLSREEVVHKDDDMAQPSQQKLPMRAAVHRDFSRHSYTKGFYLHRPRKIGTQYLTSGPVTLGICALPGNYLALYTYFTAAFTQERIRIPHLFSLRRRFFAPKTLAATAVLQACLDVSSPRYAIYAWAGQRPRI
jgi:hypothetical protein